MNPRIYLAVSILLFCKSPWATDISLAELRVYPPNIADDYIYNISVKGEINNLNELVKFKTLLGTNSIDVSLEELQKGEPLILSLYGISGGTIQAVKINHSGEGWFRLQPFSKRLTQRAPRSARAIDLNVKRHGSKKEWVTIVNTPIGSNTLRLLRFGKIFLDKDPSKMSMAALIASPPRITNITFDLRSCDNVHDIYFALKIFSIDDTLRLLDCQLQTTPSHLLTSFLLTLNTQSYFKREFSGVEETGDDSAYVNQLKYVHSEVFDFSKKGHLRPEDINTLYTQLIKQGELAAINFLISLNLPPPPHQQFYQMALMNIFQVDQKQKRIVTSQVGQDILKIISLYSKPNEKIKLGDFISNTLWYGHTGLEDLFSQEKTSLYEDYYSQLIDQTSKEGIFTLGSTEDLQTELIELLDDSNSGYPKITEEQINTLIRKAMSVYKK